GEAFQVLEDGVDAVLAEERHGVLGVLVEIGVEDALIHEVGFLPDVEEHPPEVVQLENGKAIRQPRDSVLYFFAVLTDHLLPAGFDLCDDGEPVTGRSLREDWAVPPLLQLEKPFLWDRHCGGFGPVAWLRCGWLRWGRLCCGCHVACLVADGGLTG